MKRETKLDVRITTEEELVLNNLFTDAIERRVIGKIGFRLASSLHRIAIREIDTPEGVFIKGIYECTNTGDVLNRVNRPRSRKTGKKGKRKII